MTGEEGRGALLLVVKENTAWLVIPGREDLSRLPECIRTSVVACKEPRRLHTLQTQMVRLSSELAVQ